MLGAPEQIDRLMGVQDVYCLRNIRLRHANRQDGASSVDRAAIEGCLVRLNVASEEPVPQARFAQPVTCQGQSFTGDHTDFMRWESGGFEIAPRGLGVVCRVIKSYYFFVSHWVLLNSTQDLLFVVS